ncbi:MAG: GerMN domain-containing protein [Chloroflexota bacterium]|nr:GerMN domain-containing protein [Chloroflexota bacterium]
MLYQRLAAGPTAERPARLRVPRRAVWLGLAAVLAIVGVLLRLAGGGALGEPLQRLPWLNRPSVTVYFPDAGGRYFVPVTRHVSSKEVTPEGAVRQLLAGPRDRHALAAPFPPGIRLVRFASQDGTAVVELATPPSAANAQLPAAALQSLAWTLRGSDQVQRVRLVVNGSAAGETSVRQPEAAGRALYFMLGPYVVPVATKAANPEDALRQYLDGPAPSSGLRGLPQDVGLLSYRFDPAKGLIYLNLRFTESVQQLALADPTQVRRIFTGLVATLTQYPGVNGAVLDFQGHAALGLGQCADLLRTPLARPQLLNDEAALAS